MALGSDRFDRQDWVKAVIYECMISDFNLPLEFLNTYAERTLPHTTQGVDVGSLPALVVLRLYLRHLKNDVPLDLVVAWPVFKVIHLVVDKPQFVGYNIDRVVPTPSLWVEASSCSVTTLRSNMRTH
jgi:hypothetical protein